MEQRLERILNFGHAIDHLVLLIFPTAVIALAREFNLPYEDLLPLSFPGFVAFGLGALPAGWLGDLWGRRPMMLVFFFGTGLSCIAIGFANTPAQLGLALTVMGGFAAIYHPVGYAILHGLDPKTIGKTMGINGLWGNLGIAFAALIAGALTEFISWRAAFFVPGLFCMAGGVSFFLATREMKAKAGSLHRGVTPLTRGMLWRLFFILMAISLAGTIIFNATTVVMPKLFEQEIPALSTAGTFEIGIAVCAVFSAAAFAQIYVGGLMDKKPIRDVLVPLAILQVPFLLLAGYVQGWALLPAAFVMMFFVFGLVPVGEVMVARFVHDRIRARFNALRFAINCGVGATAVPLVALLYGLRQDFTWLFIALAAGSFAAALATLWFPGQERLDRAALAPAE
jgi:MFS family permease